MCKLAYNYNSHVPFNFPLFKLQGTSKYNYIEAFLWKFFIIIKALPCSCFVQNKAHTVEHSLDANKALSTLPCALLASWLYASCFISPKALKAFML